MTLYANCYQKIEEQKPVLSEKQSHRTNTLKGDDKSKGRSAKEIVKCSRCQKGLRPIKQDTVGWARKLHKKCWKEDHYF